MVASMSNRLYSNEKPTKMVKPKWSFNFLEWLWTSGLGILVAELAIYFAIVPAARFSPEHRMLMWFFLPIPPILNALLTFFRPRP